MFYKFGFLITAVAYCVYDLIFILTDPAYDYLISIRQFGVMMALTILLSIILLIWIQESNLAIRISKSIKISLFWNYLILIISNGFVLYLTVSK